MLHFTWQHCFHNMIASYLSCHRDTSIRSMYFTQNYFFTWLIHASVGVFFWGFFWAVCFLFACFVFLFFFLNQTLTSFMSFALETPELFASLPIYDVLQMSIGPCIKVNVCRIRRNRWRTVGKLGCAVAPVQLPFQQAFQTCCSEAHLTGLTPCWGTNPSYTLTTSSWEVWAAQSSAVGTQVLHSHELQWLTCSFHHQPLFHPGYMLC